ncbi:MAG: hypothetical protein HY560_07050 [Gemmatimonadetes bacterium]|nr:hypothetical protein [Gemmatimonadota bacterium]
MKRSMMIALAVLLAGASSAFAQAHAWRQKWYWGAQGGAYLYQTPTTGGIELAYSAGGHWLITGRRSALYFALDQIIFPSGTSSTVTDPSALATGGVRTVTFTNARRIQATIIAIPSDTKLQVFGGGGFAIHQITNATPQGPFASAAEAASAANAVSEVDTKAFLVLAAGAQYRMGRWAIFANYNFMPGSRNFLLTADQQAITGGLRYALTSAHEDVTTDR